MVHFCVLFARWLTFSLSGIRMNHLPQRFFFSFQVNTWVNIFFLRLFLLLWRRAFKSSIICTQQNSRSEKVTMKCHHQYFVWYSYCYYTYSPLQIALTTLPTIEPNKCSIKERIYYSQFICRHEKNKKGPFPPYSLIWKTVLLRDRDKKKKTKNKQWPWPCLGVSMEMRPHYKAFPTVCYWQASPAKDMLNKFES